VCSCSILILNIEAWVDYLKDLLNRRLGKGSSLSYKRRIYTVEGLEANNLALELTKIVRLINVCSLTQAMD